MSYLTQMAALTTQNFVSAATGIALAIALFCAFARASGKTVGNFWVDLTRCTLYSFPSPDGGYHACWGNAAGRPNFRCIILPGVASLAPSEGSARITSGFPVQPEETPAAHL